MSSFLHNILPSSSGDPIWGDEVDGCSGYFQLYWGVSVIWSQFLAIFWDGGCSGLPYRCPSRGLMKIGGFSSGSKGLNPHDKRTLVLMDCSLEEIHLVKKHRDQAISLQT